MFHKIFQPMNSGKIPPMYLTSQTVDSKVGQSIWASCHRIEFIHSCMPDPTKSIYICKLFYILQLNQGISLPVYINLCWSWPMSFPLNVGSLCFLLTYFTYLWCKYFQVWVGQMVIDYWVLTDCSMPVAWNLSSRWAISIPSFPVCIYPSEMVESIPIYFFIYLFIYLICAGLTGLFGQ